jgi:hypothetical protein
MNRSGCVEECDDDLAFGRWRGQVTSAIRGHRGQAFLCELAEAMDAMPIKELITDELIDEHGNCCTIGVICKARGIDVSKIDPEDPRQVGDAVGIARQLAAEIEYENDDFVCQLPKDRWVRMRTWVEKQIR